MLSVRLGELAGLDETELSDTYYLALLKEKKVTFGATVTLLDVEHDAEVVYRLVGEDESDADAGKISISAPIARAMLGKSVGDEVIVRLPKGDREYEVVKVEYKAIL